jgi:hypothetical protein
VRRDHGARVRHWVNTFRPYFTQVGPIASAFDCSETMPIIVLKYMMNKQPISVTLRVLSV